MEELQKQIIALQLIQELIVDVLDEKGIVERSEFEILLQKRVDKFNDEIENLKKQQSKTNPTPFINGIVGEA